jgi:CheY-like chemotaxis protein
LLELLLKTGSAFDVLEYIQSRPQFSQIPLLLYTGAMDPDLLARAQKLGATSVLPKGSYAEIAQRLSKFVAGLKARPPAGPEPFSSVSTTDKHR